MFSIRFLHTEALAFCSYPKHCWTKAWAFVVAAQHLYHLGVSKNKFAKSLMCNLILLGGLTVLGFTDSYKVIIEFTLYHTLMNIFSCSDEHLYRLSSNSFKYVMRNF